MIRAPHAGDLDRLLEARDMTDADLRASAQGCTETSCLYHGAFNVVLRERGLR